MSKTDNGGPAFSRGYFEGENMIDEGADGMSLRDYFAAKAMQGMISSEAFREMNFDDVAIQAYQLADAMLLAEMR